jgi:hypothetical protein
LTSENCERDKRNYTKSTNEYWSDIIFKQRAAKKAKISEEMSLVADKYSENDPVSCSIDDLSVTEIRDELKEKRRYNEIKKQRKTFRPFKEVNDNDSVVTFCVLMSGTDLSVVKSSYELFFILYCYFLYKRNKYPNSVLSPIIFPRK